MEQSIDERINIIENSLVRVRIIVAIMIGLATMFIILKII